MFANSQFVGHLLKSLISHASSFCFLWESHALSMDSETSGLSLPGAAAEDFK